MGNSNIIHISSVNIFKNIVVKNMENLNVESTHFIINLTRFHMIIFSFQKYGQRRWILTFKYKLERIENGRDGGEQKEEVQCGTTFL